MRPLSGAETSSELQGLRTLSTKNRSYWSNQRSSNQYACRRVQTQGPIRASSPVSSCKKIGRSCRRHLPSDPPWLRCRCPKRNTPILLDHWDGNACAQTPAAGGGSRGCRVVAGRLRLPRCAHCKAGGRPPVDPPSNFATPRMHPPHALLFRSLAPLEQLAAATCWPHTAMRPFSRGCRDRALPSALADVSWCPEGTPQAFFRCRPGAVVSSGSVVLRTFPPTPIVQGPPMSFQGRLRPSGRR